MGRPLNKKYFGTGAGDDLRIQAKVGSNAAGAGFIVRQRGSKRFEVNVAGNVGVCALVDKEIADLAAGEMTLSARNTGGNVKRVVKISGKKATLSDGTVVAWDFTAASAGKVEMEEEADTFSNAVVTPVITISSQPSNQTVTAPATATFSVTASVAPSGTLTYQWKKNGTNVSGATSASYTTPATTAGDTGTFTVVVSSTGAAPVTSTGATLTAN